MLNLTPEDIEFLKQKGINPDDIQEATPQQVGVGRTIASTLKGHAGGIFGGGVGTVAGAALAPETAGLSLLIPVVAGLAGGYVGQKAQNLIQSDATNQSQAQDLQAAEEAHPIVSTATDIAANALASGGSFSPKTLLRAGRGLIGKTALSAADESALQMLGHEALSPAGLKAITENAANSQALKSVALQSAINPAIDTGVSLATGNGIPSGRQLIGDIAGGALFGKQAEWASRITGHPSVKEPSPEPSTFNPEGLNDIAKPTDLESPSGNSYKDSIARLQKLNGWDKPYEHTTPTPSNTGDIPVDSGNTQITPKPTDTIREGFTVTPEILQKVLDNKAMKPVSVQRMFPELKLNEAEAQEVLQKAYDYKDTPYDSVKYNPPSHNEWSPDDIQKFNDSKQKMSDAIGKGDSDTFLTLWKEHEALKNKYGGTTPESSSSGGKNAGELREPKILNPMPLVEHIKSGRATTGSVLEHLSNEPENSASAIAKHLLSVADKESLNVPWTYKNERSNYNIDLGKVTVDQTGVADSRIVLEEAIHSLTSNKIPSLINRGQGESYYNRLQAYLKIGNNEAIKSLIQSYLHVAEKLGWSDKLFKDTPDESVGGVGVAGNADAAYNAFGKENKNVAYAMGDLHEFLAHAWKNEQFQNLLNEIESPFNKGKSVWQTIKDAVKRLLGMDVKTGSMLEHVLQTGSDIAGQERSNRAMPKKTLGPEETTTVGAAPRSVDDDHFMGRIGRTTRAVLDRVRDINHPGAKPLADAVTQALNEKDSLVGRWKNRIIEAGKGMSKGDMSAINRVMDEERATGKLQRHMLITDKQRSFYDEAKKLLSDNGDYRLANNEPVYRNGKPTPLKKDPTYWPNMANQNVEQVYRENSDQVAIAKLDATFDKWNQSKLGMTPAESADHIAQYKKSLQGTRASSNVSHQDYFNASRKAMGVPLPPEFREPNPVKNLSRYFDRQAIDNSHYKFVENNPTAMAALGAEHDAWGMPIPKMKEGSLVNNPQVKSLLEQFQGETHGPGEDTERTVSSLVSNVLINGPALEMHKFVSNEVTAVSQADNPYQAARALGHAVMNIRQGYQHAVEGNVVKLTATSTVDMFNGTLNATQRMQSVGKLIRDVSTLGGLTTKVNAGLLQSYFEYLVPSKLARANAGDVTNQQWLKRLDPSYTVGKRYTPAEQQQLASTASNYVHGTGDIRSMPSWMMNDSEVSGFFKLAHWSVAQTNNFMRNVWTPAVGGDIKPLMMSVFGATIGGYVIKELREQMQGKKSPIPSLSEIASSDRGIQGNAGPLMYNAIAAMQYAGFGGLLSQIAKYPFDFVYKNKPQGATFPLDQIAGDLFETIKDTASAIANDPHLNWVDLSKTVTMHILQTDMQLSRIAINQGINTGLITGLPAEKKQLSDKMSQLRRFNMVEGLPLNDIEPSVNPMMNIEQQKFKHTEDIGEAAGMLSGLVGNIIQRYGNNPDLMFSKLKALKQNAYETFPSMENMPIQFFKYMQFLQKEKGPEAAQSLLQDFMKHQIINRAKSSIVPG